ncbi:MAG: EAL domain-containing protein [Acidimicrobiaceae bacterium]|nr:EAL domain-containing protein [Acidimicrobiaceae bacterium]
MFGKLGVRIIDRQFRKKLVVNMTRLPFSDRRFWIAQAMVAVVFLIHLGGDFAHGQTIIPVPGFVWVILLFVPVVYAGLAFGLVGSLTVAVAGIIVLAPSEILARHTTLELWGAWSIFAIVLIISVMLGISFEESRRAASAWAFAEVLAKSEEYFRVSFENNMAPMGVADLDGINVWVNPSYCEMVGLTREELVGKSFLEHTHPEDRYITETMNRRARSGDENQVRYTKRYVHKNGGVILAEVSRSLARDRDGNPSYVIASIRDITEERALADQLSYQVLHDFLTGLPNRVLFQDRLQRALDRAAHQGGRCALFLMNLDNFREVSNALGHHIGDQLLINLAHRLEKVARSSGTLCRFRSDEFIYLEEGLDDFTEIEEIAESLLGTLSEPFLLDGTAIEQTASIGVVMCDVADKADSDVVLQNVFTALYEAKRQGKARHVLFTPDMGERVSSHFKLAQDLTYAASRSQLSMHYQPIMNLTTNQVAGYEALMRWEHPELGSVPPDVFIPLSEESEQIFTLGEFALDEAASQAATWKAVEQHASLPYVAVNLSARQFHDPNLLTTIKKVLESKKLDPRRLVLEITETAILSDMDSAMRVTENLKRMNIRLALDDFGTGYSSFSYLARLQPDIIKIDRSFVSPVHASRYTERLLEAMVSLCRTLELTVIAEGVETQDQLVQLCNLGCQYGQGFLFSPAVPTIAAFT